MKYNGYSDDNEKQDCQGYRPGRPEARVRIENGQINRANKLFHVAENGDECVSNSSPQRQDS